MKSSVSVLFDHIKILYLLMEMQHSTNTTPKICVLIMKKKTGKIIFRNLYEI